MSILFTVILAAGLIGPLDHTIVSPAWLEQNLNDPNIIVVEIGSAPSIDQPHIPTARFVSIDSIVARDGWPPDEMPPVEQLTKAFENAGVGDDGRIVLYSANPLWATRAWFTLDYLGQGYRAAILDGGFTRWLAEKRGVATKRYPYLPKTFTAYPDESRLISMADVNTAIESGAVLIDARPAREFYGLRRGQRVTRRGHIPGAHCDPWQANLNRDGSFRPPSQLRADYGKVVGKPDARVIVYCRTGMEASMPYFVLRSLGYDVVLYDGSYTEWSRELKAPVQRLAGRP